MFSLEKRKKKLEVGNCHLTNSKGKKRKRRVGKKKKKRGGVNAMSYSLLGNSKELGSNHDQLPFKTIPARRTAVIKIKKVCWSAFCHCDQTPEISQLAGPKAHW